jgi:hypothetical protein
MNHDGPTCRYVEGGLVSAGVSSYAMNERTAVAERGAYRSVEALLLAEGTHYAGAKKWLPRCGWMMGPAKQCYRNSAKLTHKDPARYRYCEGFALSTSLGPLEHAWVEDSRDGLVIDRTWPQRSRGVFGRSF